MKVNSLNINNNNVNPSGEVRRFNVNGNVGAEFFVFVANNSNGFYNFKTQTFSNSFNKETIIKEKLTSNSFSSFIRFPSATSTYNIVVVPNPTTETTIDSTVLNTQLSQIANTTLTFSLVTANTSTYKTFPSDVTVTGDSTSSAKYTSSIDWTVENVETDANGFGLRLTRQPVDSDWYHEVTEAIVTNPAGDGVASNTVTVADTTGIVKGITLHFTKGTTAATAGRVVTKVDAVNGTISFNGTEDFEEGETMTFRAKGAKIIARSIGVTKMAFTPGTATTTKITKTVRADGSVADEATDGSNAKIAIDGTYGLSGGSHVTFTGVGVDNSSTNNINVVTASSSAGLFTCDVAQSLTAGTVLTFSGSSRFVNILGVFTVTGFPSSNATIKLDIDNFITPGTAS
tara:strand:- start:1419 stop:2621 length:1203 start_codon:yes stop_codon:yes gene_type:complete